MMELFNVSGQKETDNQNKLNQQLIESAIKSTCFDLTLYVRDANIPREILYKYKNGMIIKEKGFVDATALSGGMVTTHRYMILSNHMTPMIRFEGNKEWALCVANTDSRFLVLGKAEYKDKRVTVLLHLNNDETWQIFKSIGTEFAKGLLANCFDTFKECVNMEPIPSVSTDEWLSRCKFPIGISDSGEIFLID